MTTRHIVPVKIYVRSLAVLLVLTALTTWIAFFDLGPFSTVIAMTIAVVKAAVVVLFFMHLRYSGYLIWVVASAGFFWLILLIALIMGDFATRSWAGQ